MPYNLIEKWSFGAFIVTIAFVVYSCAKPANEELFPPATTASCSDGVLNQGEYFIDCGGPCEPCATGRPSVSFQADSTWMPIGAGNRSVNSDFATVSYTGGRIFVFAADTFNSFFEQISISFSFPESFKVGVHELNTPFAQENYLHSPPGFPPGQVNLDYGVISITNKDSINNLVSGEFKYTCKPDVASGFRVAIFNGVFKDIPTKAIAP